MGKSLPAGQTAQPSLQLEHRVSGAGEASEIRTKPGKELSAEGETRRHGASDV